MQPSNQQPPEANEQQAEVHPEAESSASEEAAFYEFPAEVPAQQAEPTSATPPSEKISPVEVSEQDIQSGLVYPPPPSYYQNMRIPAEKPPLPMPASGAPLQASPQAAGQFHPGIPPHQVYAGMVPPPRARGSRKKYWIILSILSATILLSCGLCSWWAYSNLGPVVQDATSITYLVTNYYQHIKQEEYEAAYNYLASEDMSQATFIEQAQQRDNELGSVSSFQITGANPQVSDSDANSDVLASVYSVTLSVVRGTAQSYNVHLELRKPERTWRITSFDLI